MWLVESEVMVLCIHGNIAVKSTLVLDMTNPLKVVLCHPCV